MPRRELGLWLVRRAAVLGHPVAHSLSPVLHTAAYRSLGLSDWRFDAIDCDEAGLAAQLAAASAEWAGFSCTMPLKRIALELAAHADPVALAVGAANTLLPTPAGWSAAMTDVDGIMAAVAEAGLRPAEVTVLGAGGTAQAALGALAAWDVQSCTALVREPARTGQLRATAERLGVELSIATLDLRASALGADLIISTLPAGAADFLRGHGWRPAQALLDAVYQPWPTAAAIAATRAGCTVVSGALMLLHQAAAQVELMTGRAAPVEAMRAALRERAPGCGV